MRRKSVGEKRIKTEFSNKGTHTHTYTRTLLSVMRNVNIRPSKPVENVISIY